MSNRLSEPSGPSDSTLENQLDLWTSIGENILVSEILDAMRRALQNSDKTRYRVSQETGIDQGHLSRFLSGEKGLSFDAMELLADALGLEIVIRQKRRRKGK